ncbi:hypothetical protein ABS71_11285 [bacterium SCN 62-11]|nr:MAG: hypothetical protein ABS71_11285 [bacterium SCN 62-11]
MKPASQHHLGYRAVTASQLLRAQAPIDEFSHPVAAVKESHPLEKLTAHQPAAQQLSDLGLFFHQSILLMRELHNRTEDTIQTGVAKQRRRLEFQLVRRPQVIGVQESHPIPCAQRDAVIACLGRARRFLTDIADLRKAAGHIT